jgi:molybdopterin-biosynthesis enzyme MoeA-like protein
MGEIGPAAGKDTAPDLTGFGSKAWAQHVLEEPDHDKLFGKTAFKEMMPSMTKPPKDPAMAKEFTAMKPEDLNAARRRMARIPQGADLVENPISKAPGFWIGNVIVMAGVPSIMQAMLDSVAPKLLRGAKMLSVMLDTHGLPEGAYGEALGALAKQHPTVSIGSYPRLQDGRYVNQIVLRCKDADALTAAERAVAALMEETAQQHRL